MQKLDILPNLTKDYILERITQEEIMEYYTGIKVDNTTLEGNSFLSPFREDNDYTCNYWYSISQRTREVRLKLKDWNGEFDGDIFDVASIKTKINSKTSQGFKLLLCKIARDFKIHKYTSQEEREKLDYEINQYKGQTETRVIVVHPRKLNRFDESYWTKKFGISKELLRYGLVIFADRIEIEGKDGYLKLSYTYNSRDPAYAYYGGEINGIKKWRIYFPLRKKGSGLPRFYSNSTFIQGIHMIIPARVCIITKSHKDVLVYRSFGYIAVAVPSETYVMTKNEISYLKRHFDILITNFDYDKTGIRLTQHYKRIHKINPIMFTKGRFNQPNYGVKDLSEFREMYGETKTKELLDSLMDKYQDELHQITLYNYNSLKWI
jgi:hypothetical protein